MKFSYRPMPSYTMNLKSSVLYKCCHYIPLHTHWSLNNHSDHSFSSSLRVLYQGILAAVPKCPHLRGTLTPVLLTTYPHPPQSLVFASDITSGENLRGTVQTRPFRKSLISQRWSDCLKNNFLGCKNTLGKLETPKILKNVKFMV